MHCWTWTQHIWCMIHTIHQKFNHIPMVTTVITFHHQWHGTLSLGSLSCNHMLSLVFIALASACYWLPSLVVAFQIMSMGGCKVHRRIVCGSWISCVLLFAVSFICTTISFFLNVDCFTVFPTSFDTTFSPISLVWSASLACETTPLVIPFGIEWISFKQVLWSLQCPFVPFTCWYICLFVLFTCSMHCSTEYLHRFIDIWSCRPWADIYASLDITHASTSCQTPNTY